MTTTFHIEADCGNSLRKNFLKDFNCAFANGDMDFLLDHVCEDIVWDIVGDKLIQGKEAFMEAIKEMCENVADELKLNTIITHGRNASASGEIKMAGKSYAFCDVYIFTSASSLIIKKLKSYVIVR